jgi:beta-lactamase class D
MLQGVKREPKKFIWGEKRTQREEKHQSTSIAITMSVQCAWLMQSGKKQEQRNKQQKVLTKTKYIEVRQGQLL